MHSDRLTDRFPPRGFGRAFRRSRDSLLAAIAGVLMLAVFDVALAQEPKSPAGKGSDTEPAFDFDAPPPTIHKLTDTLSYGSKIAVEIESKRNRRLRTTSKEVQTTAEPSLTFAASYDPNKTIRAFFEIELDREFYIERPSGRETPPTRLKIESAYVMARDVQPGLTAQVGRQSFEDERKWLYDKDLDAARLFYQYDRYGLEASVSRENFIVDDLLNKEERSRIYNYGLTLTAKLSRKTSADAYVFFRDDHGDDPEDLLFLGIRSIGRIAPGLTYWIDAAHVLGDQKNNGRSTPISGYGIDVGSTYAFKVPFRPSVTFAGAFGSGDSDADDGTNHNFRQSGLQRNKDKFNGVTSFKYYGETLDPELSNLIILTAGTGARPTKRTSIDLVYHHYWQHQPSEDLRDTSIRKDPDGRGRDVGHGIDLILGFGEIDELDTKFVAGTFLPGRAFGPNTDPAYFLGAEIEYKF